MHDSLKKNDETIFLARGARDKSGKFGILLDVIFCNLHSPSKANLTFKLSHITLQKCGDRG